MQGASLRARWVALVVLCMGTLMIVLDTTIVNVALPSIKTSLGFSETALAWVVNAYALTFAGFLLLGGRLGDLFGQRKFFLIGILLFTLSSLACGFSISQEFLIAARAFQGIGGAVADAVALSLVMRMFTDHAERAKAMGVFGFVAAGGGSIGVLLGGVLTGSFNWHWIFFINIPIGIAVIVAALWFIEPFPGEGSSRHLDVWGAIIVTASLMLAVYATLGGNTAGWTSAPTLGTLGLAAALMALFLCVESRVKKPLMPLSLFKVRNLAVSNVVGVLWSASMFSWFFISALYMQQVLHYSPLSVGLAFLPANLIMAAFSFWFSARVVLRFGIRGTLAAGLAFCALGLALFSRAGAHANFLSDILLPMALMGVGAGVSFNPMLLAAMEGVPEHESGLASGVVNTAFMMGGSLGLAVLASIAAHVALSSSLLAGYQAAFMAGAISAALASGIAFFLLRIRGAEVRAATAAM